MGYFQVRNPRPGNFPPKIFRHTFSYWLDHLILATGENDPDDFTRFTRPPFLVAPLLVSPCQLRIKKNHGFMNCGGTLQIVTLYDTSMLPPFFNSRLGFLNPGLTLTLK